MTIAVESALGPGDADETLAFLAGASPAAGGDPVDETERGRLHRLAGAEPPARWAPFLARLDGEVVGYAGVVVPAQGGGDATAELFVAVPYRRRGAGRALLETIARVALDGGAAGLVLWGRHVDDLAEASARRLGLQPERVIAVLGRPLDALPHVPLPAGTRRAPFEPGRDDGALATLLARAFADTPDAGWEIERVAARRRLPWFDPADVLLAVDADGRLAGAHWTKLRSRRIGEVYVLAVAPEAQGTGLGRALLHEGMAHLRERGCAEVLLWVDRDNERAVNLYRRAGFEHRWNDVAFRADLTVGRGRSLGRERPGR